MFCWLTLSSKYSMEHCWHSFSHVNHNSHSPFALFLVSTSSCWKYLTLKHNVFPWMLTLFVFCVFACWWRASSIQWFLKLFHLKQLSSAAENNADENSEGKKKHIRYRTENENNEMKDVKEVHEAGWICHCKWPLSHTGSHVIHCLFEH